MDGQNEVEGEKTGDGVDLTAKPRSGGFLIQQAGSSPLPGRLERGYYSQAKIIIIFF